MEVCPAVAGNMDKRTTPPRSRIRLLIIYRFIGEKSHSQEEEFPVFVFTQE
jgi:hypothetical protein